MPSFNKLGLLLCVALTTFAASGLARADSLDEQILARLKTLEKENAALRARVTHLEASKAATKEVRRSTVLDSAAPLAVLPPPAALDAGNAVIVKTVPTNPSPAFRSQRLALVLAAQCRRFRTIRHIGKPLSDTDAELEQPVDRSKIQSGLSGRAALHAHRRPTISSLNWTHLRATDGASVSSAPNQFVGPPYSVGPPAGASVHQRHRDWQPAIVVRCGQSGCRTYFLRRLSVPIAGLWRRGICACRRESDRRVPERCDFPFGHDQLVVHRRRAAFGRKRSVQCRPVSILRRSRRRRADRDVADRHQLYDGVANPFCTRHHNQQPGFDITERDGSRSQLRCQTWAPPTLSRSATTGSSR